MKIGAFSSFVYGPRSGIAGSYGNLGEGNDPTGNQCSSVSRGGDGGWADKNNKRLVLRRGRTLGWGLSMAICGAGVPGRPSGP